MDNKHNKAYFLDVTNENIYDKVQDFISIYKKDKELSIYLKMQYDDFFEEEKIIKNLNHALNILNKYKIGNRKIKIGFELNSNYNFQKLDLNKINKIEKYYSSKGVEIGVLDYLKFWNLKQVKNTIANVKDLSQKIKQHNFSPLETLLNAYIKVTNKVYQYEDKNQDFPDSRSVFGVTNSNKIVCAGYIELLNAILDNIEEKNIELFRNAVMTYKNNEKVSGHISSIVYLKDDKYNIDGYYYLDPTNDSKKEGESDLRLNYFLVPLKKIKLIKGFDLKDIYRDTGCFNINSIIKTKYDIKKLNLNFYGKKEYVYYNAKNPSRFLSFSKDGLHLDDLIVKNLLTNAKTRKRVLGEFEKHLNQSYSQGSIKIIKNYKQLYQSEMYKFLVQKHDLIEQIIYENSKPVDMKCLTTALYNILRKNNMNKPNIELYNVAKNTIEENIKSSKCKFYSSEDIIKN